MKLLDQELQEVSDWFGLGLHLDIPPDELHCIKYEPTLRRIQDFRTEMFSAWIKKLPEPSWSRVVKALMEIGREKLARKIALKYGKNSLLKVLYSSVCVPCHNISKDIAYSTVQAQSISLFLGVPVPSLAEKKLPQLDTPSLVRSFLRRVV